MSEEIEELIIKIQRLVVEFKNEPSKDIAEEIDYLICKMRLVTGNIFENLHYFSNIHKTVIQYLDKNDNKATTGSN